MAKAEPVSRPRDYPRTLDELEKRFGSEAACRAYLRQLRWPDGFRCPKCTSERDWPVGRGELMECASCHHQTSITAGTIFEGTRKPLSMWFRAIWWVTSQKNGASAMGLRRVLGLGSYQTAWTWLHKLRRAMVRPGRDRLSGFVEVDETYVGGEEEGTHGRETYRKAIVVVAVEIHCPKGFGRIRMRRVPDVSAASLTPFVCEAVEPGSTVHTDGWKGYDKLSKHGYKQKITVVKGSGDPAHVHLPGVHRVASLLKRWLLGTHQGAVSNRHLDYYLDEFTFRFNRRSSRSRGLLFYRLMQQAVAVRPVPYKRLVGGIEGLVPQDVGGT
jgi:transposase-like protein